MQYRASQMLDQGPKGMTTVVQGQQGVPPEGDDHRPLRLGQHRRARLRGTGLQILGRRQLRHVANVLRLIPNARLSFESDACPLGIVLRSTPPGNGSLYRSSDGVSRRGAPATNLSHKASFQA